MYITEITSIISDSSVNALFKLGAYIAVANPKYIYGFKNVANIPATIAMDIIILIILIDFFIHFPPFKMLISKC